MAIRPSALVRETGKPVMATFEKPKSADGVPLDLLPVIRSSGVLGDRPLADIKNKILQGDYPFDSVALAECLVRDNILTAFQAKRMLSNKPQGLIVGRYIILDRVGSGSMGRVYRAHHVMMDRVVALKIIAPEISSNERVVARFQREMKLVGRLDHPNVVRAYDADQINKILYIVMEYVSGASLAERLKKKGPIAPAEMVDYASQAALGLAHAHDQGIVHRDIKPSNILLNDDRRIKILDLGLGVLMEADSSATFATADGIAVGTVDYMSPEQACGREVDGRSDLYGLGCSMYHLMSGKLPFPGESPIERLGKRIGGRHTPITEYLPNMPNNFVRVLDKLLAHKPHERYATAGEAADALQSLIRPKTRPAAPPRPTAPLVPSPSGGVPVHNKSAAEPKAQPPAPDAAAPAPVQSVTPSILTVRPIYPRWFEPVARFAERRPKSALASVLVALAVTFGAGLAMGLMLQSSPDVTALPPGPPVNAAPR
jgi:serine/threonine protein kinase